jgi:Na+/H+ antiporter NhaD/arsenite permease-like protein
LTKARTARLCWLLSLDKAALNKTGLIGDLTHYLAQGASTNPNQIAAFAGEAVALASNLVNKLPPH